MILNYPIKYAVLEVKEKGRCLGGHKNITQGFIVSKCYVVESKIKYGMSGNTRISHTVVFPFQDFSCFKENLKRGTKYIGKHVIPKFNVDGNPLLSSVVDELFDTYEEASQLANQKNEKMYFDLYFEVKVDPTNPNFDVELQKLKDDYNNKQNMCKIFEQLITDQTNSMEITQKQNENNKILKLQ